MIELLLQADRLLTVDLVDAADAIYRKVAEADPNNAIAVVGMARCALARGEDHEAYRLAARALRIDPRNDMARRMEARLDEVLRTRGEVPGGGGSADGAPGGEKVPADGTAGGEDLVGGGAPTSDRGVAAQSVVGGDGAPEPREVPGAASEVGPGSTAASSAAAPGPASSVPSSTARAASEIPASTPRRSLLDRLRGR